MHLRNQAEQRVFTKHQLLGLIVGLVAFLGLRSAFSPGAETQSVEIVHSYRLPVAELSGLAKLPSGNNEVSIAAVGDGSAEIILFDLIDDLKTLDIKSAIDFSTPLVARYSLCGASGSAACKKIRRQMTSDWEALHATEAGELHVLQEHSSAIVSFRISDPSTLSVTHLNFELNPTNSSTEQFLEIASNKDPNLVEGFFIAGPDTILAAKENNPATVVRFSRSSADQHSEQRHYLKQHAWQWKDKGCDISDLQQSPEGEIYVLSQTCRKVALLEALDENSQVVRSRTTWPLPSEVKNPEALVLLPHNYFLVGSDRKSLKKPNLFLIKPE